MTDLIGGIMMVVGGGLLSASSVPLMRGRPSPIEEFVSALPFTPAPTETPADMLEMVARIP